MRTATRSRFRPRVEQLEDRCTPAVIVGLNTAGTALSFFDSATPGTVFNTLNVTGLASGETLVGIDYWSANGLLYGVSSQSNLYTIGTQNGAVALVGNLGVALTGTEFGVDFNPAIDTLRVVGDDNQNLNVNPNTGVATVETNLAFPFGDPNFGASPLTSGAAYTPRQLGRTTPANASRLFFINRGTNVLSTANAPADGRLNTVGPLGATPFLQVGFDIAGDGTAFASFGPNSTTTFLYTINLTSGAATLIGQIGTPNLRDLAVTPTAPPTSPNSPDIPQPGVGSPIVVAGTGIGTASAVNVLNTVDNTVRFTLNPFPGSTGGITVAQGDLNGDLVDDIVTATATQSDVLAVFDGRTGNLMYALPAFAGLVSSGVDVAVGRVIDDTIDIIVSARSGPGIVAIYNGETGQLLRAFNAVPGNFAGGLSVAAVDTDGNGTDEIIVGIGPGSVPAVGIFDGSGQLLRAFLAFTPSFQGGVNVAGGDFNGQPRIVAATATGGAVISVFDGFGTLAASYFAFGVTDFFGGVRVGVADLNGNGSPDVIAAAPGSGGLPIINYLEPNSGSLASSFLAFQSASLTGLFVS